MAVRAAQRARPPEPRLFEEPLLLRRTRRDLAELVGLVWLALEIVRFVRSRVERGPMTGAGSLTWLGHSCAVIQIDGLVIVTDPVLRKRIFHLRRKEPVDPAALDGST